MSDLPTPPSTYILKDLHDVAVPPGISWWPQTIGWKILAGIAVIALAFYAYRWAKKWWLNRYRKEALDAIALLEPTDADMPTQLFSILKVVLIHLDSAHAKLFDMPFLNRLDALQSQQTMFSDQIGQNWVTSLLNPNVSLSHEQRIILIDRAKVWIKTHSGEPLNNISKGDHHG